MSYNGWLPIEDAPKHRNIIVGGGTFYYDDDPVTLYDLKEPIEATWWADENAWLGCMVGGTDMILNPTHYQLLPENP